MPWLARLAPACVAAYGGVILAFAMAQTLSVAALFLGALGFAGLAGGLSLYVRDNALTTAVVASFVATLGLAGVALLIRRTAFVIHNGGLEEPGGSGSPVLFLARMLVEQVLLTGAAVGLWLLLAVRGEQGGRPRRRTSGPGGVARSAS